jgi:hypothetical protein
MREVEERHPLLRFVWATFNNPSEENVAAQSIIRYEMQKGDDPTGTKSVYQILERLSLWRTLWSRKPFFLFYPEVYRRRKGMGTWDAYKHEDGIGEHHLIRWDGSQPLAERISDMFGTYETKDGTEERMYLWDDPDIIRVRYQHAAQDRPPATYDELRRIMVCPRRVRDEGRSGKDFVVTLPSPEEDTERIPYTLIGVVFCSNKLGECDRIRLYQTFGNPIHMPMRLKNITGTQWNLGDSSDPGRVYMLFYTPGFQRQPTLSHNDPIARKKPEEGRLIAKEMGAIKPKQQRRPADSDEQEGIERGMPVPRWS